MAAARRRDIQNKTRPALVDSEMASTIVLADANTARTMGTFSISAASRKVRLRPTATDSADMARRFSLKIQAITSIAATPIADCSSGINTLFAN